MDRMLRALREFKIGGIKTNIPYFMKIFSNPEFRAGTFDTAFLDRRFDQVPLDLPGEESAEKLERLAVIASAIHYYQREHRPDTGCPEADKISPWRLAGRRRSMRH
jgi:pyruvate carboxylase